MEEILEEPDQTGHQDRHIKAAHREAESALAGFSGGRYENYALKHGHTPARTRKFIWYRKEAAEREVGRH
jgi:hypothetical protein